MNNTALFAYYYSQSQTEPATLSSARTQLPRRDQILLEKCRAFRAQRLKDELAASQQEQAESVASY